MPVERPGSRPQSRALVEASRPVGAGRVAELEARIDALERRIAALEPEPPWCPCGWKPIEGIIGGETLEEHQRFCLKAPTLKGAPS
jgi:hypothetical protein